MEFKEFIFVLIYFTVCDGVIIDENQSCAQTCIENSKFNYNIGITHVYDYEAETETRVSTRDLTGFKVNSNVYITAISPCNMELRLRNVSFVQFNALGVTALNPFKEEVFKAEFEANPMIFSFENGVVNNVCPETTDPVWVVNFKRGFLSALQNSMKDVNEDDVITETDISGECLTNYKIVKPGWRETTVEKSKNLDDCGRRGGVRNIGMQFAPHFSNLADKPLPVLKSELKCHQVIDNMNRIVQSVECTETHFLKPFSNGQNGVQTKVMQKLRLVSTEPAVKIRVLPITSRTSILFDYENEEKSFDGNVKEVEKILQIMCTSQKISEDTATLFKRLVSEMRHFDEQQFLNVYIGISNKCQGNEIIAKKFYLDAAHMCVTPASAAFMVRLIQSDHISDDTKDSWLLTLAFIPSPTKEFTIKFTTVLDEPNPRKSAILGISALIHTYCHLPLIDCSKDTEIQTFAEKFNNHLKTGCQSENNVTEKTLIALKAIGNIGSLTKAEEKLKNCYSEKKNNVELRIAAIDALRRWPCNTKTNSLLKLLSDQEEDTEVRITSYISLMRCPNTETIQTINKILQTEQVNQVGSFIWTHLTNLQKTSMSSRQEIKNILQSLILRQKFSTDALKFSRAYEKALHLSSYQAYGQANVLFTPKSYLPRSLTTNLTIELFGRAINLIEVGGRIEGFEEWVESFFGANGYFPDKTVKNVLSSLRSSKEDDEYLDKLDTKFNAKSEFQTNPQASAFMRLFGNDIVASRIDGKAGFDNFLSWLFDEEETSITKSFTFIDSSLIIPTQIGLPLNLTLNGTAVIQLLMKGHTEIQQIFSFDCDVSGYVKPSAAIQISGLMAVSLSDLAMGVQVDASLHTSTSISGKIVIKGGQLVNIEVDAPQDRMDLINFNSKLFLLEGDDKQQPKFRNKDFIRENCHGKLLPNILGLELCTNVPHELYQGFRRRWSWDFPQPRFPFSGPVTYSAFVKKTDPQLVKYNFEYKWEDKKIGNQLIKTRKVYLDTPESTVDRQFLLEFISDESENAIKANLKTPFKKLGFQGKIINEENQKLVHGIVAIDDEENTMLQIELKTEQYGNTQRFIPRLNVVSPYSPPINMHGFLTIEENKKLAIDISLENLTIRPISVKGEMEKINNLYNLDLRFESYLLTTTIKANLAKETKHSEGNVNLDLTLMDRWHKDCGLAFKYRDKSSASMNKIAVSGQLQGSGLQPLEIEWEYEEGRHLLQNKLDFRGYGETLSTKQILTYEKDGNSRKYTANLIAESFTPDLQWRVTAIHETNVGAFTSSIELQKDNIVMGKLRAHLHNHITPLINLGSEISIQVPNCDFKATVNIKKLNPNEYEGKIYIQLDPDEIAVAVFRYQDYSNHENRRHSINVNAKSPWSTFLIESDLNIGNGQFSTNNAVNLNGKNYRLLFDYDIKNQEEIQLRTALHIDRDEYRGDLNYHFRDGARSLRINFDRIGYEPISIKFEFVMNKMDVVGDLRVVWQEEERRVRIEYRDINGGFQGSVVIDNIGGSHQLNFESKTILDESFLHKSIGNLITNKKDYKAQVELRNTVHTNDVIETSVDALLGIRDQKYRFEGNNKYVDKSWIGNARFYDSRNNKYEMKTDGRISKWNYPEFDFNGRLSIDGSAFVISHSNTKEELLSNIQLPTLRKEESLNLNIQGTLKKDHRSGKISLEDTSGNSYSIFGSQKTIGEEKWIDIEAGRSNRHHTLQLNAEFFNDGKTSRHAIEFAKTSHKSSDNFKWSTKHQLEKSKFSSALDGSWYPNKELNFQNNILWQLEDGLKLFLSGDLKLTRETVNHFTFESSHEWKKKAAKNSFVLKENNKEVMKFVLDGSVPTSDSVNAKVAFVIPKVKVITTLNFITADKQIDGTLTFTFNNNKIEGKITGDYNLPKRLHSDLQVTTSFDRLSHLGVSFKYDKHKLDATFEMMTSSDKYQLKIEQQMENSFKHKSSIWYGGKTQYSLDVERKDEDSKKIVTVELTTPNGRYGPYVGEYLWVDKNGVQELIVNVEYKEGKKVGLGSVLDVKEYNGKIRMDIYTPFDEVRQISIGVIYGLNNPINVGIEIEWNGGKKMSLNANGYASMTEGDIKITAQTPFISFRDIAVGLKYVVNSIARKKSMSVYGSLQGKMVKLQGSAVYNKAGGELDIQLVTPFENWEFIGGKIKVTPNKDGRSARIQLKKNEKRLDVSLVIRPVRVLVRVRTPFDNFKSMSAEWRLDKGDNNISTSLAFKKNNFAFDVTGMYAQTTKQDFIVDAKLTIPSVNTNLSMNGAGHWTREGMKGNIKLSHNNNEVKISGNLINSIKEKKLILTFTSPLRGFEDTSITASYVNKDPFHHVASFNVEQNSQLVDITAKLVHENNIILVSLGLASDYPSVPSFVIAGEQDSSTPAKTASFVLNLGEKHLKIVATSTTEYTLREGSLSFACNFAGIEKTYSGSYSYDFGKLQKVMSLQFSEDGKAIDVRGTYEFNTDLNPGSFVLSLEDGINGAYVYTLNINHELLKHNKVIDFIIHKGEWMTDFTIKWSIESNILQLSSELNVPEFGKLSIEGKIEDTSMKFTLKHNEHITELTGGITRANGQGTFELISTSVTRSFSDWSIKGSYDVLSPSKHFRIQAKGGVTEAELSANYMTDTNKGRLEINMKATTDHTSKSGSLKAYFDLTKSQQNAGLVIKINEKTVEIKLNWIPGKYKGAMKIQITTPITGYTTLGAELQYNLDRTKTGISAYVQWADNRRVSVDLSASVVNAVGNLVINTPFENTKKIEVKVEPSFATDKKTIELSLKYGDRNEIKLNVGWVLQRRLGELQFRVSSTFVEFEQFSVEFKYDTRHTNTMQLLMLLPGKGNELKAQYENDGHKMADIRVNFGTLELNAKYDLRGDGKWGDFFVTKGEKKVELRFNYNPDNLIRLIVHTPHPRYETISGELTVNKQAKSASLEIKFNEKTMEMSAIANIDALKSRLETNFKTNWFQIGDLKTIWEYDVKVNRPFVTAQLQHDKNKFKLHLETSLTVSEHYTIRFPLQDNLPIIKSTIGWYDKEMEFIVEGNSDADSSHASITLKTPFSPCEHNSIKTDYISTSSVMFSASICGQETEIAAELDAGDRKWVINSYWRSTFFSNGFFNANLNLDEPGNNALLTLQWAHSTIEVKGRVNYNDGHVDTKLVLRNSFMENDVIITASYNNQKFAVNVDLGDGDEIRVVGEIDFKDANIRGGSMRLTTPIKGMEDVYFKLKYGKRERNLFSHMMVSWGNSETEKIEMEIMSLPKSINVRLATPLKFLRNLNFNGTLASSVDNINFEAKFSLNDKLVLDCLVKLQNHLPHFLYGNFHLYTPLTQTVSSTFTFVNDENVVSIFFVLRANKISTDFDTQFDKKQNTLNLTSTIEFNTVKFNVISEFSTCKGKIDLTSDDFGFKGDFVNEKRKSINIRLFEKDSYHLFRGLLDILDGSIAFTGDLLSPLVDPKMITITGRGTYKDSTGTIRLHGKCGKSEHSVVAESSWKNRFLEGSATINCPFISDTEIVVKSQIGSRSRDQAIMKINVEKNKRNVFNVVWSLQKVDEEWSMKTNLDTNLLNIKNVSLDTNLRISNGFRLVGTIGRLFTYHSVAIDVWKRQSQFKFNLVLFENDKNEKNISIGVSSTGGHLSLSSGQKDFALHLALIKTTEDGYKIDFEWQSNNRRHFLFLLHLSTNPTVNLNFKLSTVLRDIQLTFDVDTKDKRQNKIQGTLTFDKDSYFLNGLLSRSERSVSGHLTLSGSCCQPVQLTLNVAKEKDSGRITADLLTGDGRFSGKGDYTFRNDEFYLWLLITTPYENVRWIKIATDFATDRTLKANLEVLIPNDSFLFGLSVDRSVADRRMSLISSVASLNYQLAFDAEKSRVSLNVTVDNRNLYVSTDFGSAKKSFDIKTPLLQLLSLSFVRSEDDGEISYLFTYRGLSNVWTKLTKRGNSYKYVMTEPLTFYVDLTVEKYHNGKSISGKIVTEPTLKNASDNSFVYRQQNEEIQLTLNSGGHSLQLTIEDEINIMFDQKPLAKMKFKSEVKYLNESVEKSLVLSVWYPNNEVRIQLREEKGLKIWSGGAWISLQEGRTFGLVTTIISYNHLNVKFQMPEESLYLQIRQIPLSRKNPYEIQAYLGFLNKPESNIEFNLKWRNFKGRIDGAVALVQSKAETKAAINVVDAKDEFAFNLNFVTKHESTIDYSLSTSVTYNKPNKILHVEFNKLKLSARLVPNKDVIEFSIIEDQRKILNAEIEVNDTSILLNYDNGKTGTAKLSMPSSKLITFDVNQKHNDLSLSLLLDSSSMLIGNINWRPGVILDAVETIATEYFKLKNKTSEFQHLFLTALTLQKNEALRVLESIKERIETTWEQESRQFYDDMESFENKLNELYDKNIFGVGYFFQKFDHLFAPHLKCARDYLYESLSYVSYKLWYGINKVNMSRLGHDFQIFFDRLVTNIRQGVRDFAQDPDGSVELMCKRLRQISTRVNEMFVDTLAHKVTPQLVYLANRLVVKLQQIATECSVFMKMLVESIRRLPAVRQIMQYLSEWTPDKEIMDKLDGYFRQVTSFYTKNMKFVDSWINQFKYFISTLEPLYYATNRYFEIEEKLSFLFEKIVDELKESSVELMDELWSDIPQPKWLVPTIHVDGDRGRLTFSQHLPFEWQSFKQLPKLNLKEVRWKASSDERKFADVWNNVWSKLSFRYTFIPNFEGRGVLAGNQHYKTFDGRYFEFAGNCQYVLLRDFVNAKFTAIVVYDNYKKKSIVLKLDASEFELNIADGSVRVDGEDVEYPFRVESVIAMRIGDTVTIRQQRHFQLQCNIELDVCTFDLHGSYQHQTGGLFGNFDKESWNDLLMSNRQRTKDVLEFARSWTIGNCQSETNAAIINSNDGQSVPQQCQHLLYNFESPLAKCLKKVAPTPYLEMCMNDMMNSEVKSAALAAYVIECNYNDIKLEIPSQCAQCLVENSADIVLIVEEKKCNADHRLARHLIESIENTLIKHKIENNRYALVGFSADGIHDSAHSHTMNGQVFGSWQQLRNRALPKLQTGNGFTDLFTTLEFVTELPFRNGVRRNAVAIVCESQQPTIDSDAVRRHLRDQGLVVHIITNTTSDVMSMIESLEGNRFSIANFKSPDPRVVKRALNVLTEVLTNHLVNKSMPICKCEVNT